jgi:shikimate kinase
VSRSPFFLVGARGTGKTTAARLIADRIAWNWCDADTLLEERAGKTIRQIFTEEGEASFRDRESALLQELAGLQGCVVATGGGVVLRAENRTLLRQGVVVWLSAPADVLWRRLQDDATTLERRPNLAAGGLAEVEEVVRKRAPLYEACADWRIETESMAPEEVADRIVAWIQTWNISITST